ncbi:MAG TPA: double zinc ribbon domain-containing protein [Longimicrobiales bacterium]|nr:double zinc ribbon domain-containing protein [Longimicrobiales bacterium]
MLDLFLPPVCLACDKLIATSDSARLICRRCRTLLRPPPAPLCVRCHAPKLITGRIEDATCCEECSAWPTEITKSRAPFLMHPPADRIVHQLKYRGWKALAGQMAAPMAVAAHELMPIDVVMAVPTTRDRLRERGYNQAGLLADAVAKKLNLQSEVLLERASSQGTQTTLQPAARGANVAGAFRLQSYAYARIQNAHILIVDDVMTTGATAAECTRVLIDAGARCTSVLTYARAVDTRRLLGN